MKTLSYYNDPAIKQKHIDMARAHAAADMLRSGTYGETFDGRFQACSVGCFANDIKPHRADYHAVVAEAAGWPEWLVRLNDTLFEGLPESERAPFHVQLREPVAEAPAELQRDLNISAAVDAAIREMKERAA